MAQKTPELHFKEFPNTLQACSEMLRGETGRAATRSGASQRSGWAAGRFLRPDGEKGA